MGKANRKGFEASSQSQKRHEEIWERVTMPPLYQKMPRWSVRENKSPLPPPQKITATEELLYMSVCSHGFNLLTYSNYSYSRLIYVWQLYVKRSSLQQNNTCLQAALGNMMCSDAVWGSYLAKKISLTLPVQADFSLFAVGPWFFVSPWWRAAMLTS